ncbi:hypothetical protein [Kingella potus]|uniref:hypothetical protein n=1 Tax=Kingella potus TaxID=265175 RepID=UPI001FCFBE27|nr:hypothetical protein [Kingella potus]UOO99895.1 hypothetical protein LVJ84_07400 [Kingella potus]
MRFRKTKRPSENRIFRRPLACTLTSYVGCVAQPRTRFEGFRRPLHSNGSNACVAVPHTLRRAKTEKRPSEKRKQNVGR